MSKIKGKFSIIFILLGIIALFLIQILRPQPIDWSLNFEKKSTDPLGCNAIYNFLEDIFPGQVIIDNKRSLFEVLDSEDFSHPSGVNLILITDMLQVDQFVSGKLIEFARQGNNLFISAHDLEQSFKDSLNLRIKWQFSLHPKEIVDTIEILYPNKNIDDKQRSFYYNKGLTNCYINSFDSLNTRILNIKDGNNVNFIKTQKGKGNIYIHTSPTVFTNLNVIDSDQHNNAFIALSHLPLKKTIWDEFYKPFRKYNASPMTYVFSQAALNTAYIVLMLTILTFLIFELKRKQRIIPVIEPKTNSTLDFVEAVSRLYYFKKNHKDIAMKKYAYFLEYIRSKYYLKTVEINDSFIEQLSYKTGIELDNLKNTFQTISPIIQKTSINEQELHRVNKLIETFYKKTNK